MGLLLYAAMHAVAPYDYPDRAVIHYAQQAAGYVLVQQAADWNTLFYLPQSLNYWDSIGGSPNDIAVFGCKEFGLVARLNMNEKNGPPLDVVDMKWQFRPFDPNSPRFSISQLPIFRRKPAFVVDIADDLIP